MYCTNCGKEVHPQALACPSCGVPPRLEKKFCAQCAAATQPGQAICLKCGAAVAGSMATTGNKDKIAAALLAIFLGAFGIHKFYLGYKKEGIIMLVIALAAGVITCGVATGIMSIIGLIEGIIYITKSDEDFARTYVHEKRGWF